MGDMDVQDCSTDGTCEDPDAGAGGNMPREGVKLSNTTLWEETTLAVQQLSIVIGVALLVASLFFLMIAVDRMVDWMGEQWTKRFGREQVDDPEDPAALVGSFKRYKN